MVTFVAAIETLGRVDWLFPCTGGTAASTTTTTTLAPRDCIEHRHEGAARHTMCALLSVLIELTRHVWDAGAWPEPRAAPHRCAGRDTCWLCTSSPSKCSADRTCYRAVQICDCRTGVYSLLPYEHEVMLQYRCSIQKLKSKLLRRFSSLS